MPQLSQTAVIRYLIFPLLALVSLLSAPETAAWTDTAGPWVLQGPHAGWLRDAGARLTIGQVAARAAEFQPLHGSLSRGHTRDAYWLRLTLPTVAEDGEYWLDVPLPVLDDVRLYEARGDGGWTERRSGNMLPFAAREGPYRTASFELGRPRPGEAIYLRVETTSPMSVTPRLWRAAELRAANDRESIAAGVFFGVMTGTALLNLIGWLSTRRGLYGLFALFVAASALRWAGFDGLFDQYLFPHDAALPKLIDDALLGAQMMTGSLCQIGLLQLRGNFPRLMRYYLWLGVAPGALVMLTPWTGHFGELSTLLFSCMLPAPFLSIPAYLRLWRGGNLSGRLVAVALPVHFMVMFPAILGNIGWLPFDPVFAYVARLAALPIILTLHAGIALQTRAAERERDEAQHHAAEAQAASERERSAREERERFLAMIAHEVRTPVAVIDAAAHSLRLLDKLDNDPRQRESRYHTIRQAVARMRTLMELTEAEERLQAGTLAANPGVLDLGGITREALASFEPAVAARVSIEAADALPPLRGDARLMVFALLNLIDNAVKYARPDTPIEIGIAADAARGGALWRIRDHGPGIPADKEDVIFEKYQRVDETSAQPGLGLGLPLARQIVEKQGGQLRLDPSWPHGACFGIWLPEAA